MADLMVRALQLAAQALGSCSPNPAVGAVLARDGQVIGEGFTQPSGQAHAEIVALEACREDTAGAELFVTLEPCCHVGRTPACTGALIAAGLREAHVATRDPSPWVNGGGVEMLEQAGITVVLGEREREAVRLNEAYFHWVANGMPFVTAKYAMTLDGKVATSTGSSKWISGEAARARVGQMRARTDAVLVGVGTVLSDDPQLTARAANGTLLATQPRRVVLDTWARTPVASKVLSKELPANAIVLVSEQGDRGRCQALEAAGAEVVALGMSGEHIDLRAAMQALGAREITAVLLESGPALLGAMLQQGLVQKMVVFVAPKLAGGRAAPGPIGSPGVLDMADALKLDDVEVERVGQDLLVSGYLKACLPA